MQHVYLKLSEMGDISVLMEPPVLDGPIQGQLHEMVQCSLCLGHINTFWDCST
jgi:hypothetical protein